MTLVHENTAKVSLSGLVFMTRCSSVSRVIVLLPFPFLVERAPDMETFICVELCAHGVSPGDIKFTSLY